MSAPPLAELEPAVRTALSRVNDPEIRRPITELDMVRGVEITPDGAVTVDLLLTVAGCPLRDTLSNDITAAVGAVPGVTSVHVNFGVMSDEQRKGLQTKLRGGGGAEPVIPFAEPGSRTRVYAVASGKGG